MNRYLVLACFISARALSMTFQFPCRRTGVYGQLHDMGIYLGTKLVTWLVGKLMYIILESVPGVRFLGSDQLVVFYFSRFQTVVRLLLVPRLFLLCFVPLVLRSISLSVSHSDRQAGRQTERESDT